MSEVTPQEAKELADIFLPAFNEVHKASFRWVEKSYIADSKSETGTDFIVFDGSQELGIQHTRAVADPDEEFARPNKTGYIHKELLAIRDQYQTKGAWVYINFRSHPISQDKIKELAQSIWILISVKMRSRTPKYYFRYDIDEDDGFLEKLRPYVSEIEIKEISHEHPLTFMLSWSKERGAGHIDDYQRVMNAVNKKPYLLPSQVLLIDAGAFPIADYCLEDVENDVSGSNYEIWIIENFLSTKRAIFVKSVLNFAR